MTDRQTDRQTDGWTEPSLAIAPSIDNRLALRTVDFSDGNY